MFTKNTLKYIPRMAGGFQPRLRQPRQRQWGVSLGSSGLCLVGMGKCQGGKRW